MYTREPSEVIQLRSAPAVSIIFDTQLLATNPDVGFGQAIAETPICSLTNGGLTRKINVVACSVPVEPKSTSASPPPKTRLPLRWSAASIAPSSVGVEPNGPSQRLVPKSSQSSPATAIVSLPAILISCSLLPLVRRSGVLLKVKLSVVVPAWTTSATSATAKRLAANP